MARIASTAGTSLQRAGTAIRNAASRFRRPVTGCPINSFTPGTLVVLADGTLAPIEDLAFGDLVWTTDPVTGQDSAQPVLSPITGTGSKHLVEVTTDAGTWTATAEHPVWVDGTGWTNAEDLSVGDGLRGTTGGILVVRATHDLGWLSGQTVHNLHVAGSHTYYIVTNPDDPGTLVHNACAHVFTSPGGYADRIRTSGRQVLNAVERLKQAARVRIAGARVSKVEICVRCGEVYPAGQRTESLGNIRDFLRSRR